MLVTVSGHEAWHCRPADLVTSSKGGQCAKRVVSTACACMVGLFPCFILRLQWRGLYAIVRHTGTLRPWQRETAML